VAGDKTANRLIKMPGAGRIQASTGLSGDVRKGEWVCISTGSVTEPIRGLERAA